ncbi:hypothetical protein MCHI_001841 [Candidatus Magnetoovum chiemensis]|nr:hypothetical protein MCHI_001841 [Candidatus Magnetoovum chiemensis]
MSSISFMIRFALFISSSSLFTDMILETSQIASPSFRAIFLSHRSILSFISFAALFENVMAMMFLR